MNPTSSTARSSPVFSTNSSKIAATAWLSTDLIMPNLSIAANIPVSSQYSAGCFSISSQQKKELSSSPSTDKNFLSKYQVNLPTAISSLVDHSTSQLPPDYRPTDYDVVCGRGRGFYNRPGNKRFRALVGSYIDEYLAAKTKIDKSIILQNLIDAVRQQDNGKARFLKFDSKQKCWHEMSNDQAREKTGHVIRETINGGKQQKEKKQQEKTKTNNNDDDDSLLRALMAGAEYLPW